MRSSGEESQQEIDSFTRFSCASFTVCCPGSFLCIIKYRLCWSAVVDKTCAFGSSLSGGVGTLRLMVLPCVRSRHYPHVSTTLYTPISRNTYFKYERYFLRSHTQKTLSDDDAMFILSRCYIWEVDIHLKQERTPFINHPKPINVVSFNEYIYIKLLFAFGARQASFAPVCVLCVATLKWRTSLEWKTPRKSTYFKAVGSVRLYLGLFGCADKKSSIRKLTF